MDMFEFFAKKIFSSAMARFLIVSLIFSSLGFVFFTEPSVPVAQAQPNFPEENTWITNGEVYGIIVSGGKIYIGGEFDYVGPNTGPGVPIDGSGLALPSFPKFYGEIGSVVADGSGGWYVGGGFNRVGGLSKSYLVHILSDYTVDTAWNPNPDAAVTKILLDGSTLYAGGSFTNIGGQARNGIAAINTTTGNATAWDPGVSGGSIYDFALDGSTLYAGGSFTNIGGQARNHIAAIDTGTGLATAWDPDADDTVYALALNGPRLFAGGDFTNIGGQARNHIAAIDTSTGNADTYWNPNSNGRVRTLALYTDIGALYAGGSFTNIGGQARNHIAEIDVTSGDVIPWWDPNSDNDVNTIAVSGGTVYVGGYFFTNIGGENRRSLAALDSATGNATSWDPSVPGSVSTLAFSGSTIYAGGDFHSLGGVTRNHIAALDAGTGRATSWDPNADLAVRTIAVDGSTVYTGGYFTNIGGAARNYIAALDAGTGNATAWDPNANNVVRKILVSGSTVYASGSFTNIGGAGRNRIAALDAGTGNATAWNPNANGRVDMIALSGSIIYASGYFTNIGGQARNGIAALDTGTGNATGWNPNADVPGVNAIAVSGSIVYVGGDFTNIGGQARNRIAALDAATGLATAWNPNAANTVFALAVSGSTIFAGGQFYTMGGNVRSNAAAIDATTGNVTSWNPGPNMRVNALALDSSSILYMGGSFDSFDELEQFTGMFAQFGTNPKMKDTLSRLKVSTAANHTIELTLGAGIDWAANDTLTLTFQSDFNLGALASTDANDFDINTGTEETIIDSGTACGGSDAIKLTSIVGQVITFTACPSYTPPGTNSTITIQIGTNATTGGTGDSQITNPTTPGTYTVDLGGSIGDTNSAAVYIVTDDSATVTATVDPTFTFSIEYFHGLTSCDLGTLFDYFHVRHCEYYLAVGTNASGGAVITIQAISDGTNAKLNSDANPADDIDDVVDDTEVTGGVEGYGIELTSPHGAIWTAINNPGFNFTVNDTPIPDVPTLMLSTPGPVEYIYGNFPRVRHLAAISPTTPAGNYTQTVQYIATGTF